VARLAPRRKLVLTAVAPLAGTLTLVEVEAEVEVEVEVEVVEVEVVEVVEVGGSGR